MVLWGFFNNHNEKKTCEEPATDQKIKGLTVFYYLKILSVF